MLRKSPKDLLPDGGRFMDESHGTINPFKNKHKNKSKRTKLSNKTIQIKQPNTSKTQGTYGGGSGFFSTSHPTIPSPHHPKIIVRSASKVPIGHAGATSSLPTAARRVAINGPASVSGERIQFSWSYRFWKFDEWIPKNDGPWKRYVKFRVSMLNFGCADLLGCPPGSC